MATRLPETDVVVVWRGHDTEYFDKAVVDAATGGTRHGD